MEVGNKTQHMRIGLGMCGIGVTDSTAEIIWRFFDAMEKMGGDFDLKTSSMIEAEVIEKYSKLDEPKISVKDLSEFLSSLEKKEDLSLNLAFSEIEKLIEDKKQSIL